MSQKCPEETVAVSGSMPAMQRLRSGGIGFPISRNMRVNGRLKASLPNSQAAHFAFPLLDPLVGPKYIRHWEGRRPWAFD